MKYKIIISEIVEKDVPETTLQQTGEYDKTGGVKYEYVKTGQMKTNREIRDIYFQELEELNVEKLVSFLNEQD